MDPAPKQPLRISRGPRRLVIRGIPEFLWVQVGIRRSWSWRPRGFWTVHGLVKIRHLGLAWVATLRADAVERAGKNGPPPGTRLDRPDTAPGR